MSILLALIPFLAHAELPSDISLIYSYQCEATFLEGEGVTSYTLDCLPHQRLGLITAKYTHYLFSSASDDNFSEKGSEDWYNYPLCGRPTPRISCNQSSPRLEFGISRWEEGIFQAPLILTSSYRGISRNYGYAAFPLENGSCPEGLVPANQFEARPGSIGHPLPSSFVNFRNKLNDRQVAISSAPRQNFKVYREPNKHPCDAAGGCEDATFLPSELAQEVPYTKISSTICVIPPGSIEPMK